MFYNNCTLFIVVTLIFMLTNLIEVVESTEIIPPTMSTDTAYMMDLVAVAAAPLVAVVVLFFLLLAFFNFNKKLRKTTYDEKEIELVEDDKSLLEEGAVQLAESAIDEQEKDIESFGGHLPHDGQPEEVVDQVKVPSRRSSKESECELRTCISSNLPLPAMVEQGEEQRAFSWHNTRSSAPAQSWSFKPPIERQESGRGPFIDSRSGTPKRRSKETRCTFSAQVSTTSSSQLQQSNVIAYRTRFNNAKPYTFSSESEPDAEPNMNSSYNTEPVNFEKFPRCIGFLYASPLVFRNHANLPNVPMTPNQLGIEEEWSILESSVGPSSINVLPCCGTVQSMQQVCVQNKCRVLHIAAHGIRVDPTETRLMLEDGKGAGILVDESMIKRLIGNTAPHLVFLSVCASDMLADAFLKAGASYVVCASGDVGDASSKVFVKSFYKSLATGRSVRESFEFAQAAFEIEILNSSPSTAMAGGSTSSSRTSSKSSNVSSTKPFTNFILRSHTNHLDSLLFPPIVVPTMIPTNFRQMEDMVPEEEYALPAEVLTQLPPMPEDFVGRTLDVWAIIQHLERRRMVVVSADQESEHGLGLTSVCEVATRYLQLRSFCGLRDTNLSFGKVARVYLDSLSGHTSGKKNSWIDRLRRQINEQMVDDWVPSKSGNYTGSTTASGGCSSSHDDSHVSLSSRMTTGSPFQASPCAHDTQEHAGDIECGVFNIAKNDLRFVPTSLGGCDDSGEESSDHLADIESNGDSASSSDERRTSVDLREVADILSAEAARQEKMRIPPVYARGNKRELSGQSSRNGSIRSMKNSMSWRNSHNAQLADLCMDLKQLSANERMLVLLDECDHLVQQEHFQEALQCLLKDCPNISFLLSTHQPIYSGSNEGSGSSNPGSARGSGSSHQKFLKFQAYKNVHVVIKKLPDEEAGKLFLRRLSKLITWSQLGYEGDDRNVRLQGDLNHVYRRVGKSPFMQKLEGHPRRVIEAAMRM